MQQQQQQQQQQAYYQQQHTYYQQQPAYQQPAYAASVDRARAQAAYYAPPSAVAAAAAPAVGAAAHEARAAAARVQRRYAPNPQRWVTAASGGAYATQAAPPPRPAAAPAAAPAPAGGQQLPASLKAYAERAFAQCSGDGERAQMQAKLHGIISGALANDRLNAVDWATAPVPPLERSEPRGGSRKRRHGGGDADRGPSAPNPRERAAREARANRFADRSKRTPKRGGNPYAPREPEPDASLFEPVRGTCEDLEKDYFRLTSAPDPATVRPARVLEAALKALKARWRSGDVDYLWMCNQLKAVRQDLTVQCVKSKFTINVYETHARVALESGDVNEYNQCQTQLRELYGLGLGGGHEMEFTAYRIFYALFLNVSGSADDGSAELLKILNEMPAEAWADAAVAHALSVREALALGNYAAFFRLHETAPNMGAYVLDTFADKVRVDAAAKILRAYRPTIDLATLASRLGFDDDADCKAYVTKLGFLFDDAGAVKCKESKCDAAGLVEDGEQKSSLL